LPLDCLEIMKKVLKNCWSITGDLRKGKRNEGYKDFRIRLHN
jgi:hypothetical protein